MIFSGLYIPFLSSGRHLLLFLFTRWESFSTFLFPSCLSSSLSTSQSFIKASFYRVYSSFCNLTPFSPPRHAGFHSGGSTLDQILFLSRSISNGFNKPQSGSRTILATIDFSKLSTLSGISPFSTNLFQPASLLCCRTKSFVSDRCTCVFYQNHKNYSFESIKMFRKNLFLALYFSLLFSVIFLLLCLLPSAALFMLTTCPFDPPPL